jgi:LysR family transcriptional regulator for metE and metH
MTIEIRHLATLHAIAETGSLTRAAKRRSLTLSAVSHLVRELETLLGVELLDRRSKPIALTPAGKRLLTCADAVLPLIAATEADLARMSGERHARLYLALECHSCFDWLLPTLDTLREAWPELDLDLRLGPRFDPIPALVARDVDAVLGTDRVEHPDVHYEGIFRYEIVLVTPKDHRLAKKPWVEPHELAAEPFVTYPVEPERLDVVTRFLRPAGVEPVRARTAELTTILLQMVRSGRGVAALPRWAVVDTKNSDELGMVRLGKSGLYSELFLAVREDGRDEPHLRAFLEIARTTSFELLAEIQPVTEAAAS